MIFFKMVCIKMFNKIIRRLLLSFLLFSTGVSAELSGNAQQVQAYFAKTKSLVADFKQVSLDQHGKVTQTSHGKVYLDRPGKFRWNYKKPYAQEIVSSNGKVWFYDKDLEQVTIKEVGDSFGSTPALLLSGEIVIKDKFNIEKQEKKEGIEWTKLSPKKEDSGFNHILIGLKNNALAAMELNDNFGQLTRIYFSNLKQNVVLEKSLFVFKVPKGVDIFAN